MMEKTSTNLSFESPSCLPQTEACLRRHPDVAAAIYEVNEKVETAVDGLVFCLVPSLREAMGNFYRRRKQQLRDIATADIIERLDARLVEFISTITDLEHDEICAVLRMLSQDFERAKQSKGAERAI